MKKILTIAAVVGLVAVPSIAVAAHNSNGQDDDQANTAEVENENENEIEDEIENEDEQVLNDENENDDEDEDDEDEDDDQAVVAGSITLTEARSIAEAELPNKTFEKVEMETEHGESVFSIRFTDNSRVDVNGAGEITRTRDRSLEDDNSDSGSSGRH